MDYLTGHHFGSCILKVGSKCMIMHIGSHNPLFVYNIDGHELEEVEQCKDLGAIFDQSLKLHSHVAKAIYSKGKYDFRPNKEIICIFERACLNLIA